MGGRTSNKAAYFDKLKGLLEEYQSIFIVTVDNVSSQQMHKIRKSLRGDNEVQGVVLMGKNTMVSKPTIVAIETTPRSPTRNYTLLSLQLQVRRAIKGFLNESPEYERLLPHVKGILNLNNPGDALPRLTRNR